MQNLHGETIPDSLAYLARWLFDAFYAEGAKLLAPGGASCRLSP
jgi:hypothetical protein